MDTLAALASTVAVIVAMWAVVSSQRAGRQDRQHLRLMERHRAAVDLLAAFEEIQNHRAPHFVDDAHERNESNEQLKSARARYVALLRASEERLVISRGMSFRHIPYGSDDGPEAKHLKEAPKLGNPESEEPSLMAVRGEIVGVIEALRTEANAH